MNTIVLAAKGIVKRFGGVTALNGVSFDLRAGEIHALCGENGAGKSTLIKLLAGVHVHGSYNGEIVVDGKPAIFRSMRDAEHAGVAIIHQELALFPEMTVAENLFLGVLPQRFGRVDWEQLQSQARGLLKELNIDLDPAAKVGNLGVGQQQLVEITRALGRHPRVLVLDEPTAALTQHEIELLLHIVRRLRDQGVTCVYISHKLNEVFAIADRITVLRDGEVQGTRDASATDPEEIIQLMVGRPIEDLYPKRTTVPGVPLLRVNDLSVARERGMAPILRDISFSVAAGEVLGIGGLMGAGRSELLMHLIGQFGLRLSGEVQVDGKHLLVRNARDAMNAGVALVSEDRKRYGLILEQSVAYNLTLASMARVCRGAFIDKNREEALIRESVSELRIKTHTSESLVATLSGGNQQKVVLGKALLTKPRVLLLDEPTRGIDVGAKLEVYELMNRLTAEGKAIVMVSSELNELIGMSDRIVMLHEGSIGGVFTRAEATEEKLLAAAMGRLDKAA